MKRILYIICAAALLASCDSRENSFGRLDQFDKDLRAPQPVSIREIKPTNGGAVIKVNIPDDDIIRGVIATYDRNGVEVTAKCSRYVDSLVVEGFSDTKEHIVKVASFNASEVQSEAVEAKVTPLIPTIMTVKPTITPTFGGVQVHIEGNPAKQNLAVTILRCADVSQVSRPKKDIQWLEVSTLFTESDSIRLTRRGIEPTEAIFGVYIRDPWGSFTDTLVTTLTPIVEIPLDKSKFKDALIADDNISSANTSWYPVSAMWDGSGASATPHFFVTNTSDPMPGWITIDLGATVQIDRIATLPRIGYNIWQGAQVRDFEFWGSMEPSGKAGDGEHGFDDSWFCLGKFTQFKPSGYAQDGSIGTCTVEDNTYFNNGNDFEMNIEEYPRCYDNLRYLRVVFANTFATFELGSKTGSVQFGEVSPYGRYIDENE